MCETIHVLQLIAAVTVLIVGLYIYENERVILKFRENMVNSLNDIESKCHCNPEVKQDGEYESKLQKLEAEIAVLIQKYTGITAELDNTSLLVTKQKKLITELQQNQTRIIADLKGKTEWISEQKLKNFIREEGRDLVIIIDSSASIGDIHFKQCLKDVATLVSLLCPRPDPFDHRNPNYNQVAVISFSTEAKEIFDFKKYQKLETIQQAIHSTDYDAGGTCTEKAFDMAKHMFTTEKGMRSSSNIKKEVLFLTDGEYNCANYTTVISKANSLKAVADVYGLLIGIESVGGQEKLSKLVTGSNKKSLFTVGNYRKFSHLVTKLKQDIDNGVSQCAQ